MNQLIDYSLKNLPDGSTTVYHPEYDQCYHNLSGAWEEAWQIYGTHALNWLKAFTGTGDAIDLGFGLGYNLIALWEVINQLQTNPITKIFSLEKEPVAKELFERLQFPEPIQNHQSTLIHLLTIKKINNLIPIELILGDARKTIQSLTDRQAILWFWDPFSPVKNPELWSLDLFRLCGKKSKIGALLFSYSASNQFRSALFRSGWSVFRIPGLYPKGESTGAIWTAKMSLNTIAPSLLSQYPLWNIADIDLQDRIAFRDVSLISDRQKIINTRLKCRAFIRARIKKNF